MTSRLDYDTATATGRLTDLAQRLPATLWRSLARDQGVGMGEHARFTTALWPHAMRSGRRYEYCDLERIYRDVSAAKPHRSKIPKLTVISLAPVGATAHDRVVQ